jgi:hypothetical protein
MAEQGRIRITHSYGEPIPEHVIQDHHWVHEHLNELIEQYGRCYMLVYNEQVLGTGKTWQEAINAAEENLSPDIQELYLMVEWVGPKYRIFRAEAYPVTGTSAKGSK